MGKEASTLTDSLPGAFMGATAIVTGGGRGIGAASAERLASLGAQVVIVSRTEAEVRATVEAVRKTARDGGAIEGIALDLSAPDSTRRLFDFALEKFRGPVTVLVNNAAIGYVTPFAESTREDILREWRKIQAINIETPLLLSHEFMRRLVKAEGPSRPGTIINISSLGGVTGTEKFPGLALYVTSKAAIIGMTEALAVEGKPLGIRVNAVAPGAVDTEMLRKAAPHLRTETTPADVARVISALADSRASSGVTGTVIEIHSNL